ncbi:MAG: DUF5615 family PIN-like protein [Bacteroidia bacterium]
MKFVADEGVDAPIVKHLRQNNHDVFYIAESERGISDDEVLEIANKESRVLITRDKDFGELVYRMNRLHSGVVLIRLEGLKPQEKAIIVHKVIDKYQEELATAFTVIQPNLVRIRSDK